MDETYYPPRLSSFFIFLISSVLLVTSTLFIFLKSQKPPSIKIPYIPPPEQAVNWKTYSGSGLSFRYPTEWADAQTSPLSTRTLITLGNKLEITYGSYYNQIASREMTIDEYIRSQSFINNEALSTEKISMSDFQGYRFTHLAHNANYFITTLVLAKTGVPSNILLMVYRHDNAENTSSMPPTLSRLLSTFNIIDSKQDTSSWKTYIDTARSYSFSYPPEFTLESSAYYVKISNLPDFEKNGAAFILSITPQPTDEPPPTTDSRILTLMDKYGYNDFHLKYPKQVLGGNFFGNPPWNFYIIYLSTNPGGPSQQLWKLSARIHDSDNPAYGGNNQFQSTTRAILSTFRFISPTEAPAKNDKFSTCKIAGCSSELCVDASSPDMATTCIYRNEYTCLKYSRCEIQSNGGCGWTQTPQYQSCLSLTNK